MAEIDTKAQYEKAPEHSPAVPKVVYDKDLTGGRLTYSISIDPQKARDVLVTAGVSEKTIGETTIYTSHMPPEMNRRLKGQVVPGVRAIYMYTAWFDVTNETTQSSLQRLRGQADIQQSGSKRERAKMRLTTLLPGKETSELSKEEIKESARQAAERDANLTLLHEARHLKDTEAPLSATLMKAGLAMRAAINIQAGIAVGRFVKSRVKGPLGYAAGFVAGRVAVSAVDRGTYLVAPAEIKARKFANAHVDDPNLSAVSYRVRPSHDWSKLWQ